MKTSELTGALLDYWVARAEGYTDAGSGRRLPDHSVCVRQVSEEGPLCCLIFDSTKPQGYAPADDFYQPTVDWGRGGAIIDREPFGIFEKRGDEWFAGIYQPQPGFKDVCVAYQAGPTMLMAAMRAYVASKLGEEVPDQPR